MERYFLITAENGIHARPATKLVNKAMNYNCIIYLATSDKQVDLKSIMGVMSLGIYRGKEIKIITDGPEEIEALEGLTDFMILEGLGRLIHD